jgi:hypothetical protein
MNKLRVNVWPVVQLEDLSGGRLDETAHHWLEQSKRQTAMKQVSDEGGEDRAFMGSERD